MKKVVSILFSILMFISISDTVVMVSAVDLINTGTYVIESKLQDNMVIDIDNASEEQGANVQLYSSNLTSAQQFKITKSGDYYIITAMCSGLALDVAGGSKESGTNVQQYEHNSTKSQKWKFESAGNGYYYIKSALGNYLDVSGGGKTDGTNIQVYKKNKTDSQKWKLNSVDATYSTKVISVDADSVEDWCEQIVAKERSLMGIGELVTDANGNQRYTGNVIADRKILKYKTVSLKVPKQGPYRGNKRVYTTKKVKVPCKIEYTLHKHSVKNVVNSKYIGKLLTSIIQDQDVVLIQSCSCGYESELTWHLPVDG